MEKSCFKGKKAIFLGDSITFGVGTSCPENIYHQYLARSLELGETVNYGISGSRIAHQEPDQNGGAFSVRYETMDDDADFVFVFGGVNDFGHGIAHFGDFSDRTINTFYGACHVLFGGLAKKYVGKTVVVMTPLHYAREADPANSRNVTTRKQLIDYVEAIREVAQYYALPVLDLYKMSGIVPYIEENRALYMPDGLHPNDNGNKLIAQRLEGFLLSL